MTTQPWLTEATKALHEAVARLPETVECTPETCRCHEMAPDEDGRVCGARGVWPNEQKAAALAMLTVHVPANIGVWIDTDGAAGEAHDTVIDLAADLNLANKSDALAQRLLVAWASEMASVLGMTHRLWVDWTSVKAQSLFFITTELLKLAEA